MRRPCRAAALALLASCLALTAADPPWLAPMREVNARFAGNPGYVVQFGDSISNSMAFWSTLGWTQPDEFIPGDGDQGADGLPKRPKDLRWRDLIKGCNAKGPEHGNQGGWTLAQLLPAIGPVLARENPEVAIVMIGTNDISGRQDAPPGYADGLRQAVDKCLAANCIPILNTIPPRRGHEAAVAAVNALVRAVAEERRVPLVDYHAALLEASGGAWDGTVMHSDGVHPSNLTGKPQVFAPENLRQNGYALRTWVNFLMFRELYFRILSAPKPFVEAIGTVEPVRPGIRCDVVADTQVGAYSDPTYHERAWNWGAAEKIKLKGIEEFLLLKFDLEACRGMTVAKATLYLPRTEQCVIPVVGVSTIGADWQEGTGNGWHGQDPPPRNRQGEQSRGGATFSHADFPARTWTGADGGNFLHVVFGQGGSAYGFAKTGWADSRPDPDGNPEYSTVELPREVAQSLVVADDTYGICVSEEKGQRAFCKGFRRVPNPNHFVWTKEAGKGAFLIVEGKVEDTVPPAAIKEASARPGKEAGEIVLAWTCPGDDGEAGGQALGYDVYLSTAPLDAADLQAKDRLARHRTARPHAPGQRQEFFIDGLPPGVAHQVAVVAYDRVGNRSAPVLFSATPREVREVALAAWADPGVPGDPAEDDAMRVWACPPNAKLSPVDATPVGDTDADVRRGNPVWDGHGHAISLAAGANDFAAFQLVVENKGADPLVGIELILADLQPAPGNADDALVLLATADPATFQSEMSRLMADDPARAEAVFASLRELNAWRRRQAEDPLACFREMETLKAADPGAYARRMLLLSGGKSQAPGQAIPAAGGEISWVWAVKDKHGQCHPDALVPFVGPIDIPNAVNAVPGQRAQVFYVDLHVPHRTRPGDYVGTLAVRTSQSEMNVPIRLTVWDFALPDTPTFIAEMNGYSYLAMDPDHPHEGILELYRLAHRNRLNPNIVPYSHHGNFTVPAYDRLTLEGSGASLRIGNLAAFDAFYGPLLDGSAFRDNPRRGVPVSSFYLPFYEQWPCRLTEGYQLDQQADSLDIRDDFTPAYRQGWANALGEFARHLQDQGYTKTAFQVYLNNKYIMSDSLYWCLDEPMFRDDFLAIRMFNEFTRQALAAQAPLLPADFRIDLSRVESARDFLDQSDLLVMAQDNVRNYAPMVARLRRTYRPRPGGRPQSLWIYGGTSRPDDPATINRGFVLASYFMDADGVVPWQTYGKDESWDDADAAEHAVFYPAWRRWGRNGACGSLRMKSFRDGQQDAEYLNLLLARLGHGITRRDLKAALDGVVSLESRLVKTDDLDAGRVYFTDLTPNKLEILRRTLGHQLAITAQP